MTDVWKSGRCFRITLSWPGSTCGVCFSWTMMMKCDTWFNTTFGYPKTDNPFDSFCKGGLEKVVQGREIVLELSWVTLLKIKIKSVFLRFQTQSTLVEVQTSSKCINDIFPQTANCKDFLWKLCTWNGLDWTENTWKSDCVCYDCFGPKRGMDEWETRIKWVFSFELSKHEFKMINKNDYGMCGVLKNHRNDEEKRCSGSCTEHESKTENNHFQPLPPKKKPSRCWVKKEVFSLFEWVSFVFILKT